MKCFPQQSVHSWLMVRPHCPTPRPIKKQIKKMGCIELCGSVHTAQKQTPIRIHIGFCVYLLPPANEVRGKVIFLYLSSFCSWGEGGVYPSKQWTGVYPSMQWGWGCLPRGGVCLGGCLSKGVSASYWNAFLSVSMSVSVSGSVNVPLFLPATCSKSSKGIIPTCGFSVVKG